jgi:beta-galactosidase/beta-glucuronidase
MKHNWTKTISLCAAFLLLPKTGWANPGFGQPQLFVNDWKFKLASGNENLLDTNTYKDWRAVTLPHDWSVEGPYSPDKASATGYLPGGMGWYEKEFTVPMEQKGNKVYIYFEGVYNRSTVYLNGHKVGERPNGYLSFMYDLTPYINWGAKNEIKVQVDHTRYNDSRWYTGSGIYRDVYLVYANPVHVSLWGIFCNVNNISAKRADLTVATTLRNESLKQAKVDVQLEVFSKKTGNRVALSSRKVNLAVNDSADCVQKMVIKNPEMWSIDNPNLYKVVTKVYVNGQLTETDETTTGMRQLVYDPDKGFFLNGVNTKLKGVCIHHDAGCLGSAVPKEVWARRLRNLKAMGCNAIRLSHNPQAPYIYDLCDEIGLVMMDEAFDEWEYPKKKWVKGWNKGTPTFDGNYDFFKEWGERDLRDMILRDRNHPSIIMWSIGNEVDYPNDPYSHPVLKTGTINQPVQGGYLPDNPPAERLGDISKRLVDVVKHYDLSRPVTAALAGAIMSNETSYPFNLDICGYNYTEDRYVMDHKKYPKRVLYGSENGSGLEAWKTVRDSKNIFAQFIWTGIDYLGESGEWPSRGFYTGLLDFGGYPKPRGYFRRVMWTDTPSAYIGTYLPRKEFAESKNVYLSQDAWPSWNYKEGQVVRVVSYTNTPQARLLLNGKQIGETKPFDEKTFITYWDVPFEAGKLTVEGLDKTGKTLCSYDINTSGRPNAIKATPDVTDISKERGVSQIEVNIVDENNIPVFLSDDELTCNVEGPVRLLGLESSNNSDMGDYKDNKQRVFHGRLIAYVQATGAPGVAKISFSAPWLKLATVNLNIK